MNNLRFILSLCMFFLFQGCANSIKQEVADPTFLQGIESIKIYNKTQNKHIPESIEITDKTKISKIIDQIRELKEYSIDNLRAHFGFYQVDIHYADRKTYEINVVYTIYQGVVISDMSDKTYKNDGLESLISYYFQ